MTYRLAKSLEVLRNQINSQFPNRDKKSDGWIGDAKHASRASDHNPWLKDAKGIGVVTAFDFTHDVKTLNCHKLAKTLVESRDSRIKYIIWNKQIISSKQQPWVWRAYSGANAHKHHLHISVNAHNYDDKSEWKLDSAAATSETSKPLNHVETHNSNFQTPPPKFYVVTKGDSLWKIAGGSEKKIKEIKELNKLSSDTIFVGQKLRMP
jgi:LysM repeat protein